VGSPSPGATANSIEVPADVEKPCVSPVGSARLDRSRRPGLVVARMVKFDPELKVEEDGVVVASGPVNSEQEEIVELCAWVFQRGATDAAVTEMTHQDEHGNHHALKGDGELKVDGNTWKMGLARVGKEPMAAGQKAFAVAVAMIKDKKSGNQEVIWWGHPVELKKAPS
jgi:hypothetical protein